MNRIIYFVLFLAIHSCIHAESFTSNVFTFDSRCPSLSESPYIDFSSKTEWETDSFLFSTTTYQNDEDNDGMPDWYEQVYGFSSNDWDSNLDADNDGISNIDEYNAGTNPCKPDVWGNETIELNTTFSCDTRVNIDVNTPSQNESVVVIRISNIFICDTDGYYNDDDNDGIPNWWEARFSPSASKLELSKSEDIDNDGMSNYDEFIAYTDPTDSASKFIVSIKCDSGSEPTFTENQNPLTEMIINENKNIITLGWKSAKNRTYSIYSTENISNGWSNTPDTKIIGTGERIEYKSSSNQKTMFYKVIVHLTENNRK